jgi:hypothetical protein
LGEAPCFAWADAQDDNGLVHLKEEGQTMASNFPSQPSTNHRKPTDDYPTDTPVIHDPLTRADQEKRDAMNVGFLRHPWVQRYITWQTGLPHTGQELRHRHNLENLNAALICLVLGFTGVGLALRAQTCWLAASLLLVISWGLVLAALRSFRLPNRHVAAHGELTGSARRDRLVGQALSSFLLLAPMGVYQRAHVTDPHRAHHRWRTLLSWGEPTFMELRDLGFKPGAPKKDNWRHLWRGLLFSPLFYGRCLHQALRDTFFSGTPSERCFSLVLWAALIGGAALTSNLTVLLVAYGLPRILFETCQVLRVLIEHIFLDPGTLNTPASYRRKTWAVILAKPFPDLSAETSVWRRRWLLSGWIIAMISYQPARWFVCTGDTCNHPTHHIRPGASFANHERERMELIKNGVPIYSHWGLITAIDAFFIQLERQSENLFDPPLGD